MAEFRLPKHSRIGKGKAWPAPEDGVAMAVMAWAAKIRPQSRSGTPARSTTWRRRRK